MKEDNREILLVEDDPSLGFVIKDGLEDAGFKVRWEKDGNAGFERFYSEYFSLCLLDVMLPKKDGFTLAKEIRKINPDIPIIFMTAKGMVKDKAEGFASGADDYITKPFAIEELTARMDAVINRAYRIPREATNQVKEVYTFKNTEFNYNNLSLTVNNNVRTLTTKEGELLRLFCLNLNNTLEREVALKLVWGENDYFLGRSMDVFIARLRKYLNDDPDLVIETIPKIGFSLKSHQSRI